MYVCMNFIIGVEFYNQQLVSKIISVIRAHAFIFECHPYYKQRFIPITVSTKIQSTCYQRLFLEYQWSIIKKPTPFVLYWKIYGIRFTACSKWKVCWFLIVYWFDTPRRTLIRFALKFCWYCAQNKLWLFIEDDSQK